MSESNEHLSPVKKSATGQFDTVTPPAIIGV